jgi:hypothetical protein
MQTVELIEVTGKSAKKFSRPKKAVRSIHIQPVSSLLFEVSPIQDLQMTTKRLQRVDRIYAVANLAAVTTLATSLVYTFLTCISVFWDIRVSQEGTTKPRRITSAYLFLGMLKV